MKPLTRSVIVAVVGCVGFASTARGQACAPTTDRVAVFLRVSMRQMSASTNAEWAAARVAYQVPSVDSTTIVSVTQNQTCLELLAAFNAAVPISPTPTRIYAVKVGTVYVAVYPTPNTHDWPMTVLDSKFRLVTKFAM